eukprot:GHVS01049548.1.p1 GENE.GHVS01049548.1~~GHVS01049548.1.p1  ORF type:complete len:129 (+),score=6.34 GHVS01049548.1:289-675(+)
MPLLCSLQFLPLWAYPANIVVGLANHTILRNTATFVVLRIALSYKLCRHTTSPFPPDVNINSKSFSNTGLNVPLADQSTLAISLLALVAQQVGIDRSVESIGRIWRVEGYIVILGDICFRVLFSSKRT